MLFVVIFKGNAQVEKQEAEEILGPVHEGSTELYSGLIYSSIMCRKRVVSLGAAGSGA